MNEPAVTSKKGDYELLEAWELGMGPEGYSDAVMEQAAALLPVLIGLGYAAEDRRGGTWWFSEQGVTRAEALGS